MLAVQPRGNGERRIEMQRLGDTETASTEEGSGRGAPFGSVWPPPVAVPGLPTSRRVSGKGYGDRG